MKQGNDPLDDRRLAMEQGFQDGMVARGLPAWVARLRLDSAASGRQGPVLTAGQMAALQQALKASLVCRQRLSLDLARIQGIQQYCKPLLQEALRESLYASVDCESLYYRHFYFPITGKPEFATGHLPQREKASHDSPLLDAALANFTEAQASGQALPRSDRVVERDGSTLRLMSAQAFARGCRKLDLGQRYQDHLAAILDAPAAQTASGHAVRASLKAQQAATWLVDACRAHAEGVLTVAELKLVFALCRGDRPVSLAGYPVRARQLTVYECALEQIVVLEMDGGPGFGPNRRVLVHVPADPVSPWNAAADLDAFIRRTLGKRLADEAYQRFFSRFVRRRDQASFFARVGLELMDVTEAASRDMDQHMVDYPLPLLDHLAQARIEQIKADAAFIAVPVKVLDREVQDARQARFISALWTVAGLASLFLPVVNAVVLAAVAWDMLKHVFHAVEAWDEGDVRAAQDHLLSILGSVIAGGLTAVAVRALSREWNLVDNLVTARLDDGRELLWRFDMAPLRSAAPPVQALPDEQGIYRLGDKCWVRMQSHFYSVRLRDDGQWQVLPREGHGPVLRHNGAGAWRVWCESPLEWDDSRALFRRLGNAFGQLNDEQIDQVLAIHGLDADQLRGLHVCGRAPQACLVDTVSRVLLAKRIQALVSQLRSDAVLDTELLERVQRWEGAEGLSSQALATRVWNRRRSFLQQLYYEKYPITTDTHELQRSFPSLHRLGAEELLNGAIQAHLELSAAALARRIRCLRVHEALLFDTPQGLDLARVVLRLAEQLPGADNGPAWQLFDGDALEPFVHSNTGQPVWRLHHRAGAFQLSDASGTNVLAADDLFEVMARAFTPEQRAALALGEPFAAHLRAALASRLVGQEDKLADWLGIRHEPGFFRMPQRLGDGRVGYPLSQWRRRLGLERRRPVNLLAELRDLYPGLDDEAVARWLDDMRATQRSPAAELQVLREQLTALRQCLRSWQFSTVRTWRWKARREFAQGLLECWRYQVPRQLGAAAEDHAYVFSTYGSDLDALPALSPEVSFAHVSEIGLRTLQLREVPDSFLRAFPSLSSLSVTNCRLRSLSLPETMAARLKVLDLSGNQLRMNEPLHGVLAHAGSLVYLNLSHNPLGRSFALQGMPDLSTLLLCNTQLVEMPAGVMQAARLTTLDLGENRIAVLPFAFYRSRLWLGARVRLSGNPLVLAADAWHEMDNGEVPLKLRWLDLVTREQRDRMADIWGKLDGKPASRDFFHLLARLTTSADFQDGFLARYLALRVFRMLAYMYERPTLQAQLYEHALTEHCQDNATLRFSDLEVRVRVWKALHGELSGERECALLHLGAQCWRLDTLDTVAGMHAIAAGRPEESIEFALAYRLALADSLDLPIEHDEMLNPGVANLATYDLVNAQRLVRSAQSSDALVDYLLTQHFWREHLTQQYQARLRVPQALYDELETLLSSDAGQVQIDRLQARIQQRERNLLEALSREAISRNLPLVFIAPAVPQASLRE
ncbi:NEL-type E3 ubiquitin ligase domain-containing protein [Pseudomonas sp.]|uniref:NEL-type E3 ubiquitin ligase domain-containing protein n=1 Tax=Pseudomonas sp. TaxID=306 RepID=UPI0031DACFDA